MNDTKNTAIEVLNELHATIDYSAYCTIHDGLTDIETLRDRDDYLEELWGQFEDVPIDPDTECIEEEFLGWGPGIHREEIWHWFDKRHSKGIAYLLYGGSEDYVPETKRLYALKKLCIECEGHGCTYNHGGECRFSLVHERKPRINDVDGCIDYDFTEGEE